MPDETGRRDRSVAYLVLTGLALLAAVYLIFQILGVVFKVLFLVAVLVIAIWAWQTWRQA
jgi:Flp pilus assembly protein TadB